MYLLSFTVSYYVTDLHIMFEKRFIIPSGCQCINKAIDTTAIATDCELNLRHGNIEITRKTQKKKACVLDLMNLQNFQEVVIGLL